ncbi:MULTISPECIES: SDR family oxidoreductase [unclassified Leucobacter]|uniref:SDR family oxidoreductase n=1 Tax=unclassified Leucobacter TaxID=2621730 RepID=UPI00165E93C5|nr:MULTISPECIES: SDR family oxidoreductase [unclassified Leucobacter]MBC9927742.1 SDR family oxidoreductase [Leucobacter sp. cx-169]MBC9937427.1 SDR family oxidoreductase [Leucobacter sp. cx-87]
MSRTYVVTGAASGIGKTTAELLRAQGNTVIGVDLHDADINVDLTTATGRESLVAEATRLSGGNIDAVLAIAGLAAAIPATVGVNYFGMVATLEGLRPLLAGSDAPRAVGVASMASILPVDDTLVELMLSGDEAGALARTAVLASDPATENHIYSSTKKAFAIWVRRNAATAAWAGASIPLNAIAPGVIKTPMTAPLLSTEEGRAQVAMVPMPLNGFAGPEVPANLLVWLTSVENSHLCGQVIFIDGGSDVVIRGDSTW